MKLNKYDLERAISFFPQSLINLMKKKENWNKIFVGGGFLRAVVAGEKINDIDIFVSDKEFAKQIFLELKEKYNTVETENAYTIKSKIPLQIIHRWVFDSVEAVSDSFDFTVCCAAIGFNEYNFTDYCDPEFYQDLAAKRLIYRSPKRNEDAGGSMIRVLKYYQKGYRIPLHSLAAVLARLTVGITSEVDHNSEIALTNAYKYLLYEVDPLSNEANSFE